MSLPAEALKKQIGNFKEMVTFKEDKGQQIANPKKNKDGSIIQQARVNIGERYTSMVEEYVLAERRRQGLKDKLKRQSQFPRANTAEGNVRRTTSTISTIPQENKDPKENTGLKFEKVDRSKYNIGIFKPNIDYITSENSLER